MQHKPEKDTKYVNERGQVTSLLLGKLEEVLGHYVDVARFSSDKLGKPRSDYVIKEVHLVGSVLKGVDNSDLDFLLIADKISQEDYKFIKQYLSMILFNDRVKPLATDVYVRPYDEFPDRGSFDITEQARPLLDRFNGRITKKS